MNLISIENLSKTVNDKPLFQNVTMGIDAGKKIGFIGSSGSGKSTLLHILSEHTKADTGNISRNNTLRISMLEQTPIIPKGISVKNFLYKGNTPVIKLIAEYHRCLENYNLTESTKVESNNLSLLSDLIEKENGWEIENKYLSFLSEFKLDNATEQMDNLSGGMRKKAALARALACSPNLLILDEPTNHLDIEIIEWLEKYLGTANFSFIMVTHDRYFLDSICTSILELDRGRIYKYQENYSTFLKRKEIRLFAEQNEQTRIKSILRKELKWLSRGAKARTSKDKNRKMRIENLINSKNEEKQESSNFSSTERRSGKKILDLKEIQKSYNNSTVVLPFTYKFKKGERIGIIGPNGSGKTTFLNIISGQIQADRGEVEKGINTVFGYYDQLSNKLDNAIAKNLTVIEYIRETAEQITFKDTSSMSATKFLEIFNFPLSTHRIRLEKLSGGEKRRLYLIKILIQNPNFLIFDEPTNDLDIDTMRQLENYIMSFEGTIIVVSHDRAFLDRTTDFLFIFDYKGSIKKFTGNYSEYRNFELTCNTDINKGQAKKSYGKNHTANINTNKKSLSTTSKIKRKLTYKESQEFSTLEIEIEKLEKEKNKLETLFSNNSISPTKMDENNKKYRTVTNLIEIKITRWEILAEITG